MLSHQLKRRRNLATSVRRHRPAREEVTSLAVGNSQATRLSIPADRLPLSKEAADHKLHMADEIPAGSVLSALARVVGIRCHLEREKEKNMKREKDKNMVVNGKMKK